MFSDTDIWDSTVNMGQKTEDSRICKFVEDLKAVLKRTPKAKRPDASARFFTAVEFHLTTGYACLPRYQADFDDGWPNGIVYDPNVKKEFSYYNQKFTCTILNDSYLNYILITFNEFSYCLISCCRSMAPSFINDSLDVPKIKAVELALFNGLFKKFSFNDPFPKKIGVERDVIRCNLPTELNDLDPLDCIRNKTAAEFYNFIPEEIRQNVLDECNDEAMLFSVINFMYACILSCKKLDSEKYLPNHTYNSEKSMYSYRGNVFSVSLLNDSVSGYFYLIIWNKEDKHVRGIKLSKKIVPTMKNTNQDNYLDNFRFQLLNNLLQHTLTKCVAKLYKERSSSSSGSSVDFDVCETGIFMSFDNSLI